MSENAEKFHCLEFKEPGGDLKESWVPKESMHSAFSCVHGEPEEVLNQEDDIGYCLKGCFWQQWEDGLDGL